MEIIKPVLFIDNEIKTNEDLNSTFTLPQRLKFVADNMKSILLDDIKEKNIDSEFYNTWSKEFIEMQGKCFGETITSYILDNSIELLRVNILTFLQIHFDKYIKDKIHLYDFVPYIYNLTSVSVYIDNCHLRCMNITKQSNIDYQDKKKLIFLSLEQIADIMITKMTSIYDYIIINQTINLLFKSEKLHNMYNDLYKEIYNESASSYKLDYIYTFLSTIMRSMIEEELKKIRNALSLVMSNASQMYMDSVYAYMIGQVGYTNDQFIDDLSDVVFLEPIMDYSDNIGKQE